MSLLPLSQNSTISSWHKNNERHIMTTKIKKTRQSLRKDYENKYAEIKKILDSHKELLDKLITFTEYQSKVMHWQGRNLLWFQKERDKNKDV